ncbi:ribose-phosphate pyrophosphokinase [Candidatus Nomurabacteria bacterium]|nr:ribose-phosphate pyrophosphokinase [Candidatus Kaiserbacteria bacterium]MCB9814620.1 ribose-phosphate pyrophosphokinase [Candidatus Nomurabacteria bacterium]
MQPSNIVFAYGQNKGSIARNEAIANMTTNTAIELEQLGVSIDTPISVDVTTFESSEVKPFISGNVRDKDVFLFVDFNGELHKAIYSFILTLQALQLAGVRSTTVVAPYIPYLRQDRKDGGRVPVSSTVLIDNIKMYTTVKRIITVHMHCSQVEMAFASNPALPYDHFPGRAIWRDFARERFAEVIKAGKLILIDPDGGNPKEAKKLAKELNVSENQIVCINQTRSDGGKQIFNITGPDVSGMTCLAVDDIIDTATTLSSAIKMLFSRGAAEVIACGTHAGFSTKKGITSYKRLGDTGAEVVVTDSLITKPHQWLKVVPLHPYLAHIIYQNVTDDGSVSQLIKEGLPK